MRWSVTPSRKNEVRELWRYNSSHDRLGFVVNQQESEYPQKGFDREAIDYRRSFLDELLNPSFLPLCGCTDSYKLLEDRSFGSFQES